MIKNKPYRKHLSGSSDLVTTYEEIRAGFVALALEKTGGLHLSWSRRVRSKAAASQIKLLQVCLTLKVYNLPC